MCSQEEPCGKKKLSFEDSGQLKYSPLRWASFYFDALWLPCIWKDESRPLIFGKEKLPQIKVGINWPLLSYICFCRWQNMVSVLFKQKNTSFKIHIPLGSFFIPINQFTTEPHAWKSFIPRNVFNSHKIYTIIMSFPHLQHDIFISPS